MVALLFKFTFLDTRQEIGLEEHLQNYLFVSSVRCETLTSAANPPVFLRSFPNFNLPPLWLYDLVKNCKNEWWYAGVVTCLGQGADLHMAQLMPLPLTVSCSNKSRLVLPFWFFPFWYWLTRVVPDKIQKSHKTIVCCVCVSKLCLVFYHKQDAIWFWIHSELQD